MEGVKAHGDAPKPERVTTVQVVGEYSIHCISYPGNVSRFGLRRSMGKHFLPIRPTYPTLESAERRLVSILEQGTK